MVVMTIVSVPLIESKGRRILHLVGLGGMCVLSLVMTAALSFTSVSSFSYNRSLEDERRRGWSVVSAGKWENSLSASERYICRSASGALDFQFPLLGILSEWWGGWSDGLCWGLVKNLSGVNNQSAILIDRLRSSFTETLCVLHWFWSRREWRKLPWLIDWMLRSWFQRHPTIFCLVNNVFFATSGRRWNFCSKNTSRLNSWRWSAVEYRRWG